MDRGNMFDLFDLSDDVQSAIKSIVDIVTENIWPLMLNIKYKLSSETTSDTEGNIEKLTEVFALCSSQIKKCLLHMFEIFKLEHQHKCILQESRVCILERLSWCVNKLEIIQNCLNNTGTILDIDGNHDSTTDSLFVTPMYFVNWIDQTFDLLTNLSNIVYGNDKESTGEPFDMKKNELIECIKSLHISIDELLLSAVTLSKYCLSVDRNIVTARCQVVLRETKTLIMEIIDGDLDNECVFNVDSLKLPIMPSNVNILIDVLKDVLYALETNTNTALLNLLVHCFSCFSPVEVLKQHFKSKCVCKDVSSCEVIKEFDLYNERLLQIGCFAVSCSTDQKRILSVRSGIASLEALEPYLVPAIVVSSESPHSESLVSAWCRELTEIRNNVFLIVDPAAFVDKCKQMMQNRVLEVIRNKQYTQDAVQSVINIGTVLYDFFMIYIQNEPEALAQKDKLTLLLKHLDKVLKECKTVLNMVTTNSKMEFKNKKVATTDKLMKRLKLLFTLVTRINNLYNKDDQDEIFGNNDECTVNETKDVTGDISKNMTYIKESKNSKKQTNNTNIFCRSIFGRTETKSISRNVLKRLSKHLNSKKREQLNFSIQLEKLFLDKDKSNVKQTILYSPLKTKSLRKTVLNKNCTRPLNMEKKFDSNQTFNKIEAIDITAALQITEILDQISDMSVPLSATNQSIFNLTTTLKTKRNEVETKPNAKTLNINNGDDSISRHIWNIPVNADIVDICLDKSGDVTNSNVGTLERINDLNLLENRLNDLKMLRQETNL